MPSPIFVLSMVAFAATAPAPTAARSLTMTDSIAAFLEMGSCESDCKKACDKACPAPVYCGSTSSCSTQGAKVICDCTCKTSCSLEIMRNIV